MERSLYDVGISSPHDYYTTHMLVDRNKHKCVLINEDDKIGIMLSLGP